MALTIDVAPPPPPPPVISVNTDRGDLNAANAALMNNEENNILSFGGALTDAQKAGMQARLNQDTAIYNLSEDLGINLSDGMDAGEAKQLSTYISTQPNIAAAFRSFHDTAEGNYTDNLQNSFKFERKINGQDFMANILDTHLGEFGLSGDGVLNEDGNVNDTFNQLAADWNTTHTANVLDGVAQTAKGGGGGGGGGAKNDAKSAEKAADKSKSEDKKVDDKAGDKKAAEAKNDAAMDFGSLWDLLLSLFDEDGDGKISPEELKKGLKKLDKNGDGKISKDELKAAGLSDTQSQNLMDKMDKNNDGSITIDGLNSELDAFVASVDTDGKAGISKAELQTLFDINDKMTSII